MATMSTKENPMEREAPKPPPVPRLNDGMVEQPAHTVAEPLPAVIPALTPKQS
jgi:hypothetical protein